MLPIKLIDSINSISDSSSIIFKNNDLVLGEQSAQAEFIRENHSFFKNKFSQIEPDTVETFFQSFYFAVFTLSDLLEFRFIIFLTNRSPTYTATTPLKLVKICQTISLALVKRELAFNNKQIAHHQIEKEDLDRQLNQYKLNNLIQGKKHFHVSKENKLIDSVATGDMLQVEKQYAIFNQANHHVGVLSHGSRLRHEKNLCISVVAVTTRIAIANGVYYETAYDLSDWWIRKIEESNSCDEIIETELFLRILLSFAEQISSCQRKGLSDFVIQVQDYIVSTLYEGISLGEIAAFFNYNPNYLSKKFKKETGLPIKQYMLKEKIKESDNLIKYTDYSLLDIATMLHFSDYSHYYRCYKKIKGESPKNYEKKVR